MVVRNNEDGFTIVEMIVTLVVMSLFVGLFFQAYLTELSQQTQVLRQASANDIAMTNLKKIIAVTSPLLSSITCDSSPIGNQNNLTINTSAPGSSITFTAEPLTGTSLPSSTTQTLKALYPRGCGGTVPVEIVSTVTFGSNSVTHATYVD